MLIRLIYVSTAHEKVDLNEFRNILAQAQTKNARNDLTGMLAFNSQKFLQVLEGSREMVNYIYHKIARDPRHTKLEVMGCKEIEERLWPNWSMGFAAANTVNRSLFLKYSMRSVFDPYGMKFDAAEKLLIELTTSSIDIAQPRNTNDNNSNNTEDTPKKEGSVFMKFLKNT
jgi:Sensors of blue-light using FAD